MVPFGGSLRGRGVSKPKPKVARLYLCLEGTPTVMSREMARTNTCGIGNILMFHQYLVLSHKRKVQDRHFIIRKPSNGAISGDVE